MIRQPAGRVRFAIPLTAVALAVMISAAAQDTPQTQEPGINQEWLNRDLKAIRNLRELLPPGCDRLSKLKIAWPARFNEPLSLPNRGERNIGFGATDLHT